MRILHGGTWLPFPAKCQVHPYSLTVQVNSYRFHHKSYGNCLQPKKDHTTVYSNFKITFICNSSYTFKSWFWYCISDVFYIYWIMVQVLCRDRPFRAGCEQVKFKIRQICYKERDIESIKAKASIFEYLYLCGRVCLSACTDCVCACMLFCASARVCASARLRACCCVCTRVSVTVYSWMYMCKSVSLSVCLFVSLSLSLYIFVVISVCEFRWENYTHYNSIRFVYIKLCILWRIV